MAVAASRNGTPGLIEHLRREEDLAVLYITHDLGSAKRYSAEVLVMHDGRVVERGDSDQVIEDPQDEHTNRLLAAARIRGGRWIGGGEGASSGQLERR